MSKTKSDFDLAVDYAFEEAHRVGSVQELTLPVATVVRIVSAQGVIDNGGLPYFFESDWPGQPPYSVFVDAYRTIGANDEAQALADAVSLFPFPEPHLHEKLRNEFLDPFQNDDSEDDDAEDPDSPFEPLSNFLCGNQNVWRLLEAYVKQHSDSFRA